MRAGTKAVTAKRNTTTIIITTRIEAIAKGGGRIAAVGVVVTGRLVLVALEKLALEPQQAMDGLGLGARGLGQALGRSSGGCTQQDLDALGVQTQQAGDRLDNGIAHADGCLAVAAAPAQ